MMIVLLSKVGRERISIRIRIRTRMRTRMRIRLRMTMKKRIRFRMNMRMKMTMAMRVAAAAAGSATKQSTRLARDSENMQQLFGQHSLSRPGVGAVEGAAVGVTVGGGAGQLLQEEGQQSNMSCPYE